MEPVAAGGEGLKAQTNPLIYGNIFRIKIF